MQSAAFFPLILLLLVPNGQVIMYLALNLIAAYCTYFLLRRLSLNPWACATGAVMFGLNGTFAWFRFAPSNPICFLPMALLAVEMIRDRVRSGGSNRWWLLALAIGLSVVAGFPEMAYLDGLLVGIWTLFRLPGLDRRECVRYLLSSIGGAVVGAMLASPILIAFADYLPHADVGGHSGAYVHAFLPHGGIYGLLFPYVYGPVFGSAAAPPSWWSTVGGYLTLSGVFLAAVGLWSRPRRALRLALVCWSALLVARTYGSVPASTLFNMVPDMKSVASFRYMFPGLEMAVAVLAAQGLSDLLEGVVDRLRLALSAAGVGLIGLVAAIKVHRLVISRLAEHPLVTWQRASLLWAGLTFVVLVVASVGLRGRRPLLVILVGVLCLEALAMFVVPELGAPRGGHVDTAAVTFLQRTLGTDRFATLGPLAPNYGSYFGIAAINVNDTPIPKSLNVAVTKYLDPNAVPLLFNGARRAASHGPSAYDSLVKYVDNYEAYGVKYVVTSPGSPSGLPVDGQSAPIVYRDNLVQVFELPDPTPLFSETGSGCVVKVLGIDEAQADCNRPSVLQHSELYMPGWTATVNGRTVPVRSTRTYLQEVDIPAGPATVRFSFTPPHVWLGELAAVVALLAILAAIGFESRQRWMDGGGQHSQRRRGRELEPSVPADPDSAVRIGDHYETSGD